MAGGALNRRDVRAIPVYIYALVGPDDVVRYVGRSVAPALRFWMHISFRASGAVREWVASLGVSPRFVVLETIQPGADVAAVERAWIERHSATLLNVDGVPGARRRCSECARPGHNLRTCPQRKAA